MAASPVHGLCSPCCPAADGLLSFPRFTRCADSQLRPWQSPSAPHAPTVTRRRAIIAEAVTPQQPLPTRTRSQGSRSSLAGDDEGLLLNHFLGTLLPRRRVLLLATLLGTGLAGAEAGRAEPAVAETGRVESAPLPVEAAPAEVVMESSAPETVTVVESGGGVGPKKVTVLEKDLDEHDLRLLDYNKRVQTLNGVPPDFPGFIREGYEVRIVTPDAYVTSKTGLIYIDIAPGSGPTPQPGQQVEFDYIGYNESGKRVDSSYQQGQPAKVRVGINGMIPGFEECIASMRAGGYRRVVIPPELGPPTGPGTFFSAKQFEVFDVQLRTIKSCQRRQIVFYSDVVCE